MNANLLFAGLVQMMILWLSVSAHEAAHAWMADRCGDPSARLRGRVSLNPLVHLDLFGTVILPLTLVWANLPVFGWGRPVQIEAQKLRQPRWDEVKVSAAGPAVNLTLAAAATGGLALAVAMTRSAGGCLAWLVTWGLGTPDTPPLPPLLFLLSRLAMINAFLGVFNLMPVPPFDGGSILLRLLPPHWAQRFSALPRYGLMIALAIAVLGSLGVLSLLWALLGYITSCM
jgi:Zn-dependent protease